MRISDWSSNVCSSDLFPHGQVIFERVRDEADGLLLNAGAPARRLLGIADHVGRNTEEHRDVGSREFPAFDPLSILGRHRLGRVVHPLFENEALRSEEHTPELQSLIRTSYAFFC